MCQLHTKELQNIEEGMMVPARELEAECYDYILENQYLSTELLKTVTESIEAIGLDTEVEDLKKRLGVETLTPSRIQYRTIN